MLPNSAPLLQDWGNKHCPMQLHFFNMFKILSFLSPFLSSSLTYRTYFNCHFNGLCVFHIYVDKLVKDCNKDLATYPSKLLWHKDKKAEGGYIPLAWCFKDICRGNIRNGWIFLHILRTMGLVIAIWLDIKCGKKDSGSFVLIPCSWIFLDIVKMMAVQYRAHTLYHFLIGIESN